MDAWQQQSQIALDRISKWVGRLLVVAEIGQHDTECVCSTPQQEPEVKEQLDQLLLSLSEQEQVMLISSRPP